MLTTHQKNLASLMHLSTFTKYIFPFGNFILPLILWTINKNKSEFIDKHGKQSLNFQISILLYAVALAIICIPFFLYFFLNSIEFQSLVNHNNLYIDHSGIENISSFIVLISLALFIAAVAFLFEVVFVIIAAIKANQGELFKYPLTIKFIK